METINLLLTDIKISITEILKMDNKFENRTELTRVVFSSLYFSL